MVKVRYVNSEEDFVAATRVVRYGSVKAKVDMMIDAFILLAGIVLWLFLGFSFYGVLFVICGCSVAIFRILGYFIVPKMRYRREPKYKDEYFLEFSEEGILFKTNSIDSKIKWSMYHKFVETENLYILIYSKDGFSIIPKKAFLSENDEMEFKKLTDNYIKNKGSK